MSRPARPTRQDFARFYAVPTRWMDNDVFGHVNNVVYYSWIDTAVNRFLIDHAGFDIAGSPVVGIVAETGCRFLSQISYPDDVAVGLRTAHLGTSSVRYELGIFRGNEPDASAAGHFVHVYVDRATMRPVPIPPAARLALESLIIPEHHP